MKFSKDFNYKAIKRVLHQMGSKKNLFIFLISLFSLIEIGGSVLFAIGIKGVITAIGEMNHQLFRQSVLLIIIQNVMWWSYAPVSSYLCNGIAKSTMRDIKIKLCKHIFHLPMRYHDNEAKGNLLSLLSNSINGMQGIYNWSLFQVLRTITGGLGGIIIMFIMDWRLALVVFSLGVISVYTSSFYSKKLAKVGSEMQRKLAKSSMDMYELIKASKTIRLFALFEQTKSTYDKSTEIEANTKIESGRLNSKMKAINLGISSLSYVLVLFVGAVFVYYKLSDWGTVIAIAGLKYAADMLFKESVEFLAGMQSNIVHTKQVFEVLDKKIENNQFIGIVKSNNQYPVSLNNVSFSYDGKTQIIEDKSISFEKNKLNILAGHSGVGKSTIMKLILGFYPPSAGSVVFSGEEDGTLSNIRKKTAYVPQEATLMRESIIENISWGMKDITFEDVVTASKLAGVYDFICSLEDGFDTVLADDGNNLSGGQKQRILIARALLKNAPILLFDEITSALDSETETHIMKTIRQISKSKTIIFITHKKEVIEWGDKIIEI